MPRRRIRKTNRKPQEERRLRVRGIRRGTPDARRLSRAFIELALARAEADAQAQAGRHASRRGQAGNGGGGEIEDGVR